MADRLPDRHATPIAAGLRDQAVEKLSLHFAHDHLTLEDFERRLELAYRAETPAELMALTADLDAMPNAAAVQSPATAGIVPQAGRIVSIMSDTKRRGPWIVPRFLRFRGIMASTVLDLREAVLPNGLADIEVKALWSTTTIIVPRGVTVVNHLTPFMASVTDNTTGSGRPGGPVIQLSGSVIMAEVTIAQADD